MKRLAPWAWLVVLGTALALSWWSLDALALDFGVPKLLAALVSATFDGAALVAADLALRRAVLADPALSVRLLMFTAVGLSAWLNYEHGVLLGYGMVGRVLFAAPSVLSGWLFELQLRGLRRDRLHATGRIAKPLPQFGMVVWLLHPWEALKHLSRIAGSRLHSVPVTIMDWEGALTPVRGLTNAAERPVILGAPVEPVDVGGQEDAGVEEVEEAVPAPAKAGRTPVPDELYVDKLRELVEAAGGVVPSAREVARRLGVGQDRARRLIVLLKGEHTEAAGME